MGCSQERVSERERETLNPSLKDRRIWGVGGEAPTWVPGLETQALLALQPRGFGKIPGLCLQPHTFSPLPMVLFRSQLCDLGPGASRL